ncbi:protein RETICULATA-RELATED 4, chloroplastic-like [Argentina anserina]|uniref:protein RETICULATA-RELATED 4, chloroplastic-like n=1 Tax=Argentina anserina TaxID=57926 RepID=UPI0021767825|nr:protein RETICULATA-RELATED 4, chloroplastic-like [Potentilla anserina]
MAVATFSNLSTFTTRSSLSLSSSSFSFPHTTSVSFSIITQTRTTTSLALATSPFPRSAFATCFSSGGPPSGGGGGGGGGDHGGEGDDGEEDREKNKAEAAMAIAEAGRTAESLPKDLAAAVEAGRVPGLIVKRFFELENSAIFRWLLQFDGFKERLLADDLFLTKVGIECGVGVFTKTAAELERRREKFTQELDFVLADVVMAIIADFMLVWLPAPTVSLRKPLVVSAGRVTKFFYGCPDNAFQVALAGTSYSILQRIGAILRNGAKLFVVGTGASLVGTGVTNALIAARKALDKSFAGEAEDVPILSTSAAYGVYMAVSSNLRYQVLAGIIEQRILEPLLHQHKLALSAICFAVRTGNTFLGSLMWVDYARWIGIQ